MRLFRALALLLGYPLAFLLVVALVVGGIRFIQVSFFYSSRAPERLAEKQRYLEAVPTADADAVPNFVVIFFDDLGWGDVGFQGNTLIDTPRIDRAAAEGVQMTHFYASAPVCTPSRAGLLTGRYPVRSGTGPVVFFPARSLIGTLRRMAGVGNELPRDEILLPEVLAAAGYATGMVGKWHLGELPGHRPTDFGFQSYFGVLWSNDMQPLHLYRGDEIIERDARSSGERDEESPPAGQGIDQSRLTERYTDESIAFLERNRDKPFFLYLAHTFPHVPHYASSSHAGESDAGLYGDVVEDLDRSTGAVLDAIERLALSENTLVVIASDNGADYLGHPGPFRGRKGDIYEGGQRVPMVVHWPGRVAARVTEEMAMNIDLFPTMLGLAGIPLPSDREVDGRNLMPLWEGNESSPHEALLYFAGLDDLPDAVRGRRFKYLLETGNFGRNRPHLARLDADSENHDLRSKHPADANRLAGLLENARSAFEENPRGWR